MSQPNTPIVQSVPLNPFNELITEVDNTTNYHQQSKSIPYQILELEQKIKQCNRRSTVELSEQKLIDKDMRIVVQQAMSREKCKELYLTSNEITSDGVCFLAEVLNNSEALKDLSFWDNRMCDSGVMYLAKVLSIDNNTLKILNFGKNRITDVDAGELAEMLRKNQTSTELYLVENEISDKGGKMLVESIENDNTNVEI